MRVQGPFLCFQFGDMELDGAAGTGITSQFYAAPASMRVPQHAPWLLHSKIAPPDPDNTRTTSSKVVLVRADAVAASAAACLLAASDEREHNGAHGRVEGVWVHCSLWYWR